MFAVTKERIWRALGAGSMLFMALVAWRPLDEPDLFFHLSLGRAVLTAGSRVVPEPTAFADFTDPAVAAEWLWELLTYGIYQLGGFTGLSLLGVCLAIAAADGVVRLVRSYAADDLPLAGAVFSCVAALSALMFRISVRPQLVLLAGLPAFLLLARSYRASVPADASSGGLTARVVRGLGLTAISLVWAQLHGSFVLAPLLFLIQAAPASDQLRTMDRDCLRVDGAIFALLLASMGSSAYGLGFVDFIGSHAAGDAPSYIAEMASPSWAMLDPRSSPSLLAFFAQLVASGAGMLVARRLYVRELLLAALGIALLATATRFLSEASLLTVPLCTRALGPLAQHLATGQAPARRRLGQLASVALCASLLAWDVRLTQQTHGPLGQLGLAAHAFPVYASSVLERLPSGSAVLTDYPSSAPLGFLAGGRLRTFVDGRTPLYFDSTDFAVQREMMRDGGALQHGIARYAARSALVRRDSEACVQLAKRWPVALIEPLYTTFVEPGSEVSRPGLHALAACGVRYLEASACTSPDLASELAYVRAHGAADFAEFLAVERALRCGGDSRHLLEQLSRLESRARPYATAFRRVRIEALLHAGAFETATRELQVALSQADRGSLTLLETPAAALLPLPLVRRILGQYVDAARDDTDLAVRAALAQVCARAGDHECARFHATRAAVRGRDSAALGWLAEQHPNERVRRDAQRWRDVLSREHAARQ